jgi:PAS domain S-box-containing protein
MALVAAVTSEHGVCDVDREGKTVWFTLTGDVAEPTADDLLAAWSDADWDLDAAPPEPEPVGGARTVRLGHLPPTLWLAAHQHHDALIRELALYLAAHDGLDVDLPAADRARSLVSTAVRAAVDQARRAGRTQRPVPAGHPSPLEDTPAPFDLTLTIERDLAPAFLAMQDTLDAAEQLATAGLLLARPGLPEVVAVRDWACEQVTAQLAGVAPSPWPGTDQPRFADERHLGEHGRERPVDWDLAEVRDATSGVVAADDSNRIVAISRPLARLVGWSPEELIGRRVVALIPHRLREAHVAGFTRHLTTGEAHVLDVPLELPVLRADGTEVSCRFLVQLAASQGGHNLYHAWIDALRSDGPGADRD